MKKYNVTVNGETFAVEVEEIGGAAPVAAAPAPVAAPAPKAAAPAPAPVAAPAPAPKAAPAATGAAITSPLPGTVLKINVSVGQAVKAGDVVMVLEAMKMENDITAAADGTVSAVHVNVGATVQTGDALISL
ncbi:MAG: biotin/lipoyl-binding protein [Firmicutes bacterium]|nr:biotin/lipoyl-binding protein [Bacillota bacterium]